MSRSNLGRRSRRGWLTTAPAGDGVYGGGTTAATPVRQPGCYGDASSMRSPSTGVARDDELTLGDLGRRR
jgi:hypothetical protein